MQETRASIIREIVLRISALQNDLERIEIQLKMLVAMTEYRLESLTGVNTITSAKVISSVGDINRFPSSSKLAKFAGIAPLDKSTGRKRRHKKSIALAYYQRKLAEGKTKKEALICLMRRLCDIIFRLMKDGSEYVIPKVT